MCVHGCVGIKNVDGSVTFIYNRFDTNTLGMWLFCNITVNSKVKEILTPELQVNVVISVEEFERATLGECDEIYLWDKGWHIRSKETDWHEVEA